jgi:hypothetical protein
MKSRTLMLQILLDKDACVAQVKLFKKHFGASVEVTPELCVTVALVFDWGWASQNLLSYSAGAAYDKACAPAGAAYDKVRAPAGAAYDKACASAGAAYDKVRASAQAAYAEACAPAWAAYNKARVPAQAAYDEACAFAFAVAYIDDVEGS